MNDDKKLLILRDDRIVETVAKLERRINERFPNAGLCKLCGELLQVARQASERSRWIDKPIRWVRIVGYAIALMIVVFLVGSIIYGIQTSEAEKIGFLELVQVLEAGLNDIVFIAIAIYFLISFETRIKRRRALEAVHELRSIAHVVDMHQLTKDPERFLREWSDTENSPKQQMTPLQLNRYLDYCSEMLSLIGKIASLYVQHFDDAEAVAAVSEVEQLTTGLCRKIWQKIMILEQFRVASAQSDEATSMRSEASQTGSSPNSDQR